MLVSRIVLSLGLATVLAFAAMGRCAAQTDGDDSVVANVGGVKITMSDLEQEESAKLLAARYQYYQVETKALNDLIDKKLLEQKAASEHLTVAQLLDREVASKVKDPTEDQMKVYYEGIETDQPYEAVREKILEKIRQLRIDRAKAAYLQTLRTESTVYIVLAPPSATLEAANPQMTQGPKNAQVTLVEFADYECPYCQKVAPDVKKLRRILAIRFHSHLRISRFPCTRVLKKLPKRRAVRASKTNSGSFMTNYSTARNSTSTNSRPKRGP